VRGLPVERVRGLVTANTETSILGDSHVNVLALNRALDAAVR
jgi:K+-transporting ATPase ATPase C chain